MHQHCIEAVILFENVEFLLQTLKEKINDK